MKIKLWVFLLISVCFSLNVFHVDAEDHDDLEESVVEGQGEGKGLESDGNDSDEDPRQSQNANTLNKKQNQTKNQNVKSKAVSRKKIDKEHKSKMYTRKRKPVTKSEHQISSTSKSKLSNQIATKTNFTKSMDKSKESTEQSILTTVIIPVSKATGKKKAQDNHNVKRPKPSLVKKHSRKPVELKLSVKTVISNKTTMTMSKNYERKTVSNAIDAKNKMKTQITPTRKGKQKSFKHSKLGTGFASNKQEIQQTTSPKMKKKFKNGKINSSKVTSKKTESVKPEPIEEHLWIKRQNFKEKAISHGEFGVIFIMLIVVALVIYGLYHNRQKIVVLVLESRNTENRPNSKLYRKLEDAMPSFKKAIS